MANMKRPPLEIDVLTHNLQASSGKGIGAFFPTSPPPQGEALPPAEKADTPVLSRAEPGRESPQPIPRGHPDVTTSGRHDVNYRAWREIIEETESHNSSLRITNEEKYAVKDLIDELERKYKVRTSLNEIARLGLLYIIQDFKQERLESLVIKVKKS